MCFSSSSAPPTPLPPKEPTLLADDELRRRGATQNSMIKTSSTGVAATPIMTPNITLGGK